MAIDPRMAQMQADQLAMQQAAASKLAAGQQAALAAAPVRTNPSPIAAMRLAQQRQAMTKPVVPVRPLAAARAPVAPAMVNPQRLRAMGTPRGFGTVLR